MYTYEKFKKELVKQVEEAFGEEKQVSIMNVCKNNQEMKEGLVIKENGCEVAPVIYLQELYAHYLCDGDMDWCKVQVLFAEAGKCLIDVDQIIRTWDEMKDCIEIILMKKEWNEHLLQNMPFKEFLDFAVAFRIRLGETEQQTVTVKVTNEMLENWGVTIDELCQAAYENLQNEKFSILDMLKIISEISGKEIQDADTDGKMYVLSNGNRINGSIGILRTDLLREFYGRRKKGFYILPSSVHELILLYDDFGTSVEVLQNMVREINRDLVIREETLSDQIYYFDGETVKIAEVE